MKLAVKRYTYVVDLFLASGVTFLLVAKMAVFPTWHQDVRV